MSDGPLEAEEDVLLQGWLKEVNRAEGTAQLHDYTGSYVRLGFDPTLEDEMLEMATQYVEVAGTGRLSRNGSYKSVTIKRLSKTHSWWEPFDMEAFQRVADARVFCPDRAISFDLTDGEWECFDRAIRKAREV